MTLSNYPDWSSLIGATVEIPRNGEIIRTGTVEDAMPDSSALWLPSDSTHSRTMYEAALQYEAWVKPQELDGTRAYRMTAAMLYPGTKAPNKN
jgi:hypothetical protein